MSPTLGPLLTALLAVAVVLLALPAPARLSPAPGAPPDGQGAGGGPWRLAAAAGSAIGAWTLLGGPVGAVLGVVAGIGAWTWLGRLEPPAVARRREDLDRALPTAVDLVAACLDAGRAPGAALRTVGTALGGAVAEDLDRCCHRLDLGADPASVWEELAEHPQLGALGRAFARAHESGASVAEAVHHLAGDVREEARAKVEARARRLEVKVALPLGLCLLPAFVLLGIVPMVVGLLGEVALP